VSSCRCPHGGGDCLLRKENRKLRRLVKFLGKELHRLELKTALAEKPIPFKEVLGEFLSTEEGRRA
jgi:hypothetical protein